MANKIVISCAITGSIHTPSMSEGLAVTPDQVAAPAIDAAHAGAAILAPARARSAGWPTTPDPEVFMGFLPRIEQSCAAVANIATRGAATMTVDERIAAAR